MLRSLYNLWSVTLWSGYSLVPRLSLSFSHFFAHANFIREKSKGRYGIQNLAHPWPPGLQIGTGGHALHCALYHSRTAFWTVLTSLTGYLGELERLWLVLFFFFFQAAVADTLSRKKIVPKTPHSVATYIVGPHNASRHP